MYNDRREYSKYAQGVLFECTLLQHNFGPKSRRKHRLVLCLWQYCIHFNLIK